MTTIPKDEFDEWARRIEDKLREIDRKQRQHDGRFDHIALKLDEISRRLFG